MGLFTLHTFVFNRLILNGGLRFNRNLINVNESDEIQDNVRITPSALVGNISILYKLSPKIHAIASLSNAFRAPNIDDLGTLGIVDFRYEIPNTN